MMMTDKMQLYSMQVSGCKFHGTRNFQTEPTNQTAQLSGGGALVLGNTRWESDAL